MTKKKLIETNLDKLKEKSIFRKNTRYLIEDDEPIHSISEFREFQKFIQNIIILSRHRGITIKGAIIVEKK